MDNTGIMENTVEITITGYVGLGKRVFSLGFGIPPTGF